MINYLIGSVEQKLENLVVIEVNGIGYELFVSTNTIASLPIQNEVCKIYTYMQVKEDGICLFGFSTSEEKDMFLKLISVNGIGPKNALSILSGLTLSELSIAIMKGDAKLLSSIKGLGIKTAERIVLELKDKVICLDSTVINNSASDFIIEQSVEALISLGLSKNDSYKLAQKYATAESTPEDIVTKVLRGMM